MNITSSSAASSITMVKVTSEICDSFGWRSCYFCTEFAERLSMCTVRFHTVSSWLPSRVRCNGTAHFSQVQETQFAYGSPRSCNGFWINERQNRPKKEEPPVKERPFDLSGNALTYCCGTFDTPVAYGCAAV